jgi:hypothetical protein
MCPLIWVLRSIWKIASSPSVCLTRSLAPLRCNTSPLMVWMPCCLSLSHFTGSGCPSFLSAHACARAFHCLRCVEQPETQHETRRYDTDGFWNGYHRAASSVRYILITQLLSTLHPPLREFCCRVSYVWTDALNPTLVQIGHYSIETLRVPGVFVSDQTWPEIAGTDRNPPKSQSNATPHE